MARTSTPEFADWAVCLSGGHPVLKVRATSLIAVEGWLYLKDVQGGILFAAPEGIVQYAKRLESGEDPPETPAPKPMERVEVEPKTTSRRRPGK
jgi:hypothetical protein